MNDFPETPENIADVETLGRDEPTPGEISFKTIEDIERSIVDAPFRAIFQYNNFFLPALRETINRERTINLRPEYQRRSVWMPKQKSLLIESLLLNIPIPPVFLFEYDFAQYEVMDGQQRISSIMEFLDNEFPLTGLTILAPLNGLTYKQLPPRTKRSLERGSLSAIVLIKESRSTLRDANSDRVLELRKFVFERLNTGGRSLNAQELRNAIYTGNFNDLIIRLASNLSFTTIWQIPPWDIEEKTGYESPALKSNTLYRTMADCEIVLRFFALRDQKQIKGSMRSILDECMKRNLNASVPVLAQMGHDYISRLEFANSLFGEKPFRLTPHKDAKLSVAMYDAVISAVDRQWSKRDKMLENKSKIIDSYWSMLGKEVDFARFTGRANTAKDVRERINLVEGIFQSAIES